MLDRILENSVKYSNNCASDFQTTVIIHRVIDPAIIFNIFDVLYVAVRDEFVHFVNLDYTNKCSRLQNVSEFVCAILTSN